MPLTRIGNSPLSGALLAALVALAFIGMWLRPRGFDPATLVVAGDQFTDRRLAPTELPVERDSAGYDGQFYYRLALKPWTTRTTEFGIRLDYPVYRQQRIVVPALAWLLSGGRATFVPAALLLMNIAAVATLAWAAGRIVQWHGLTAVWATVVWLYPGWLLSMARDCVEIVEIALLACMLLALLQRNVLAATAYATAAVLTKETALIGVIVCALAIATAGERRLRLIAPAVIATASFAVFKLMLFRMWHTRPRLGSQIFGVPLRGLAAATQSLTCAASAVTWWYLLEIAALVVFTYLAMRSVRSTRAKRLVVVALAYGIVIASLNETVWIEDWAFLRASTEYAFFGGCVIATASPAWRVAGIAFAATFTFAIAIKLLFLL